MKTNHVGSRRTFLKAAAVAGVGFPFVLPACAAGANSQIALGVIGIGPRCRVDLGAMLGEADVRCVAVCDVQKSRREAAKAMVDGRYGKSDCVMYRDFREVLARPDIDAMLIATGDRWHAMASMMAARAGKDVYSEKPCGITIADCEALAGTMKRYARVFQAGTQRRSIANFQLAVELARSGRLGKLKTLYASVYIPRIRYDWYAAEPEPAKDVVDWDLWLGPAPWRPYNHRYCDGDWRGQWDFDSGATLLDWGAHTVDLCQWANDSDHTTPILFEPTQQNITATYANGVKLVIDFLADPFGNRGPRWHTELGTCPVRFVGEEGWVETGDNGGIEAGPASLKAELRRMRGARHDMGLDSGSHGRNFFDCIKTRGLTAANPDVMRNSHLACHAAAIAWTLNKKLRFDPVKGEFDDERANRMRSRPAREPWRR